MATIFVLEDDKDLLYLYTRALKFWGHDVVFSESAEQAIAMLDNGQCVPEIAVLDMSMPGLPGTAVVEFIRERSLFNKIPIIVVSCDEDFRQLLRTSQVMFMTKPIGLGDLQKAVANSVA